MAHAQGRKYAPPHGMTRATVNATFKDSPFEYEQLDDPSLQLWAIRVPLDVSLALIWLIPVQSIQTVRPHFHAADLDERAFGHTQVQVDVVQAARCRRAWIFKGRRRRGRATTYCWTGRGRCYGYGRR